MSDWLEKIKELLHSPKGKPILFFGFYLIFFFFLMIISRVGNSYVTQPSDYERGNAYSFKAENLAANNYYFDYTISIDDSVYEYQGRENGDLELFEFQNNQYFYDGKKYYQKNTDWVEVENPYINYLFLDINSLFNLVDLAYYESRTTYESGKSNYNFLLSTNSILKELKNVDSDIDDEANRLILSTDEDDEVNQFVLQLDSYCSYEKLCQKTMKINLQYDQFGEVKSIDNPLDSK